MMRGTLFVAWIMTLALGGCEAGPQPVEPPPPAVQTQAQPPAGGQGDELERPRVDFEQVLQPGDRIVFIGDELTQQMFYTRAVATAVLAMRPGDNLRFYNGGRHGATAASAIEWVDELLDLAQPTVVFLCFGLNDGRGESVSDELIESYRSSMEALVQRVQAHERVRQVIVLSAPAIPAGIAAELDPLSYNHTLERFSHVAEAAAAANDAGFIDLFEGSKAAYLAAERAGGGQLSLDMRLPDEQMHMVLASSVLSGLGVTRQRMNPIGFSPLVPAKMGRVRGALAIDLDVPDYEAAQRSRALYEALIRFDEAFFRLWRLTNERTSASQRAERRARADGAWGQVQRIADEYAR